MKTATFLDSLECEAMVSWLPFDFLDLNKYTPFLFADWLEKMTFSFREG